MTKIGLWSEDSKLTAITAILRYDDDDDVCSSVTIYTVFCFSYELIFDLN